MKQMYQNKWCMMTVSITIIKTRHSAWWQYYYAERLKLALNAECRGAKLKALNGLKISIHFDESNQRPLVILDIDKIIYFSSKLTEFYFYQILRLIGKNVDKVVKHANGDQPIGSVVVTERWKDRLSFKHAWPELAQLVDYRLVTLSSRVRI